MLTLLPSQKQKKKNSPVCKAVDSDLKIKIVKVFITIELKSQFFEDTLRQHSICFVWLVS